MAHSHFRALAGALVLALSFTAGALTVDALLDAMPPDNAAAAADVFDRALAAPAQVLADLCGQVQPMEIGDDTRARFALQGLALRATSPGNDANRARLARLYEAALNRAEHPEVKQFFLTLLRLCGDDATIAVLGAHICDPTVYDDVAQCIENIDGTAAEALLETVLCPQFPEAEQRARAALERMRGAPVLTHEDTGLSPELMAALSSDTHTYSAEQIAAWCREALSRDDIRPQHRAMVLQALVETSGADALPDLIEALASGDRRCWGQALELLRALPGDSVSRALAFRMRDLGEDRRPHIVAALGERRDNVAMEALQQSLEDNSLEVRLAVFDAVRPHFGDRWVTLLAHAMKRSDSEGEAQAIKNALLRIPNLDAHLARQATPQRPFGTELNVAQKTAYLELIAERQMRLFRGWVIDHLEDEERRVRSAAYAALAVVGTGVDLDKLYQRLLAEDRAGEVTTARNALVNLAGRTREEEAAVSQATALIESASGENTARLLKALEALGGNTAQGVIHEVTERVLSRETIDAPAANTAIDIIAAAQTSESEAMLRDFLGRVGDEDARMRILRHLLAAVERMEDAAEERAAALEAVEALCRNDAEREAVAKTRAKIQQEGE